MGAVTMQLSKCLVVNKGLGPHSSLFKYSNQRLNQTLGRDNDRSLKILNGQLYVLSQSLKFSGKLLYYPFSRQNQ